MNKALVFALATAAAGLSVISHVPAASAQLQVNLVIPLFREPVHNRYRYESYGYRNRDYRQGRVYRYERYESYERGRRHGNRYGIYRNQDVDYRRHDDESRGRGGWYRP